MNKGPLYLLHLDESGTPSDVRHRHFIFAGVAVPERHVRHLTQQTDDFVAGLGLGNHRNIELHAYEMDAGKASWKGIEPDKRRAALTGGFNILSTRGYDLYTFAVVVDKNRVKIELQEDPVKYAFEQICNRFDMFVSHMSRRHKCKYRGSIVADQSVPEREEYLRNVAEKFIENGTQWRSINNLVSNLLFMDSADSRMIQLADLVSWSAWRRYEQHNTKYFDQIAHTFYRGKNGIVHGLVHHNANYRKCPCPACWSRANMRRQR